jgi:hypothetical protein
MAAATRTPRALGGSEPLTRADVDDALDLLGPALAEEQRRVNGTMVGTPINFAASILRELRELVPVAP